MESILKPNKAAKPLVTNGTVLRMFKICTSLIDPLLYMAEYVVYVFLELVEYKRI